MASRFFFFFFSVCILLVLAAAAVDAQEACQNFRHYEKHPQEARRSDIFFDAEYLPPPIHAYRVEGSEIFTYEIPPIYQECNRCVAMTDRCIAACPSLFANDTQHQVRCYLACVGCARLINLEVAEREAAEYMPCLTSAPFYDSILYDLFCTVYRILFVSWE